MGNNCVKKLRILPKVELDLHFINWNTNVSVPYKNKYMNSFMSYTSFWQIRKWKGTITAVCVSKTSGFIMDYLLQVGFILTYRFSRRYTPPPHAVILLASILPHLLSYLVKPCQVAKDIISSSVLNHLPLLNYIRYYQYTCHLKKLPHGN